MMIRALLTAILSVLLIIPALAQEQDSTGGTYDFPEYGFSVDMPGFGEVYWPAEDDEDYTESTVFHWWSEGEPVYGVLMLAEQSYAPVVPAEVSEFIDSVVREIAYDQPDADNSTINSEVQSGGRTWQQRYIVIEDETGLTGTTVCVTGSGHTFVCLIMYSMPEDYESVQPSVEAVLDSIDFMPQPQLAELTPLTIELPRFGMTLLWPEPHGYGDYRDEQLDFMEFEPIEFAFLWERPDMPLYMLNWLTVPVGSEPTDKEMLFLEEEFLAGSEVGEGYQEQVEIDGRTWTIRFSGPEDPEYPYDESVYAWAYQDGRMHFIDAEAKQGLVDEGRDQLVQMLGNVQYSDYEQPEVPQWEAVEIPEARFSVQLPGGGLAIRPGDVFWTWGEDAQLHWIHPDNPLKLVRFVNSGKLSYEDDGSEFSEDELLEIYQGVADGLAETLEATDVTGLDTLTANGVEWHGYSLDTSSYAWTGVESLVYMTLYEDEWFFMFFTHMNEDRDAALALAGEVMETTAIAAE